ncbi:MAG: ABC transporter permease [Spirochaetota bacterium]|nr:ABC transporter permease [Spirochaetota bacterium]
MNFKKLAIIFAFSIFLIYTVLILSLFYFFNGSLFVETLFSNRMLYSIRLSLITASIATFISVLIAIPAAYGLSRFNFKGKKLIDTILELPMVVSPAALGAMLLIFFNNPFGNWFQSNGIQFVFTFYGIILAQFITTLGITTRLIKAAMDEIPKRYEDVARSLGASFFKSFYTITLPLSKRGIIAAAILTWAKALGEFGATITIAGSMPMNTETIPIAIYMKLSSADIEGTVALIFILIAIGLGILYAVRIIPGKKPYA